MEHLLLRKTLEESNEHYLKMRDRRGAEKVTIPTDEEYVKMFLERE